MDLIQKKQTMNSREIAVLTGKQHKHVMEAIRKMEPAWEKVSGTNFRLTEYNDVQGKSRPEYVLSKSECLYVGSKFNDVARAKLVLRWEELEKQNIIDWSNPDTIAKLAAEWAEGKKIQEQLQDKIKEDEPKVVFAESVKGSVNLILCREFAKILSNDGFKIGQNKLWEWFRDNGYVNWKNEPYQNYVDAGYFEVIERSIGDGERTVTVHTTKITGKGQVYFTKKIRDNV